MVRASNSFEAVHRPLVLVVDDSPVMRRSVEMSLTLGGYAVACAGDGEEALRMLQGGLVPDLLLTDILMPGMDGLTLIREARKLLRFTPIVALTTQSQQQHRTEGKAAGATAWLLKPTGGQALVDLVRRFIDAPRVGEVAAER